MTNTITRIHEFRRDIDRLVEELVEDGINRTDADRFVKDVTAYKTATPWPHCTSEQMRVQWEIINAIYALRSAELQAVREAKEGK